MTFNKDEFVFKMSVHKLTRIYCYIGIVLSSITCVLFACNPPDHDSVVYLVGSTFCVFIITLFGMVFYAEKKKNANFMLPYLFVQLLVFTGFYCGAVYCFIGMFYYMIHYFLCDDREGYRPYGRSVLYDNALMHFAAFALILLLGVINSFWGLYIPNRSRILLEKTKGEKNEVESEMKKLDDIDP
ncbi:hypothetical protein M3Y97_01104500 [Aphelenchoides bicaudatus]|nr:hypothetical protein M3Y97_01104500 [Aphelenchoides bicaudatus]